MAGEFPPYDDVLDPINRVFLPRADIATETLAEGLRNLGWEVEDVTAYRPVRAPPPPAPVREAIKTGKFDAVVFTNWSVLTGARWLDITFALVFIFRGWLNVKTALRRRAGG